MNMNISMMLSNELIPKSFFRYIPMQNFGARNISASTKHFFNLSAKVLFIIGSSSALISYMIILYHIKDEMQ